MLNGKVGDANVAHLAGANELLHLAPGVEVVPVLVDLLLTGHGRGWPVNQVQVDIVGAEVLQALINRLADALVVGVVELGGEPDLVASNARVLDALAYFFLVTVRGGRVYVTVSSSKSRLNSLGNLVRLRLPRSQPNRGNLVTRVERVGTSVGGERKENR